MKIEIVPIDGVKASTYNPRKADPSRLELVELSLRKLGFLSPIFADNDGEIISGHQRHLVASRMGLETVPVCRVGDMTLDRRKALNIVFNRATNDMDVQATSATLTRDMAMTDVRSIAASMPDYSGEHRCASAVAIRTQKVVDANHGRWIHYAAKVAKTLRARRVAVPLVCTRDLRVVNGIGRLQAAAEYGDDFVHVVFVEDSEAELASAMLNLLSMDFDLHTRYADMLRYGSFRRPHTSRPGLGLGFFAEHFGITHSVSFDLADPATRARWFRRYGSTVVDFGAGRLSDTEILRANGVDVTPFEPYPVTVGSRPEKDLAIQLAREFLSAVADGKAFDSVFISSVMNSVPFRKDREHIATLAAALCGDHGTAYAWTMSLDNGSWLASARDFRGKSEIKFRLDYEPGIAIGDFGSAPKVQKYHAPAELYDTFKGSFESVRVRRLGANLSLIARGPAYSRQQLEDAIEFEFDLPYEDGSRMGLVEAAKAAFAARGCFQ